MTTYTWEQRVEILKSMNDVPRTVPDLTAARVRLRDLAQQYEADPEILAVGEMLAMDLSGLLWEQEHGEGD
jgi:hypothetical protein